MERQTESQRKSLQQAVSRYHKALPDSPAEDFLNQRGLEAFDIGKYRFGFVEDPLPEHVQHKGKLAIPYLRYHPRHGWTCVSMRFRTLADAKPKYASVSGDRPRLYNTPALYSDSKRVGICEGEIDAITASLVGLPTVGIPGSTTWQSYWAEAFKGYEEVLVFTDGDDPGKKMGRTIAHDLSNSRIIPMPDGEDINSILTSQGIEALQEQLLIGKD